MFKHLGEPRAQIVLSTFSCGCYVEQLGLNCCHVGVKRQIAHPKHVTVWDGAYSERMNL